MDQAHPDEVSPKAMERNSPVANSGGDAGGADQLRGAALKGDRR